MHGPEVALRRGKEEEDSNLFFFIMIYEKGIPFWRARGRFPNTLNNIFTTYSKVIYPKTIEGTYRKGQVGNYIQGRLQMWVIIDEL